MAIRPVFVVSRTLGTLVLEKAIKFEWFPGMAISRVQRSIDSLHEAAKAELKIDRILEISTKSRQSLGIKASAFNLTIKTVKLHREFSVESAYQASKVFTNGGPFVDLLEKDSREAKGDDRLRQSGPLVAFQFYDQRWKLTPRRAFYDWLYMHALHKNRDVAEELLAYEAFTDIAFNPEKSVNCQAHAAALYSSLHHAGALERVLADRVEYLRVAWQADLSGEKPDLQSEMRFE
jgi:hypothetical protein